jgi:phenylacetaldehyde dehydrogenase
MTETLDESVKAFIGTPRQMFINGHWTDAASGKTFETPDPATGETLARIAEGDARTSTRLSGPLVRRLTTARGAG